MKKETFCLDEQEKTGLQNNAINRALPQIWVCSWNFNYAVGSLGHSLAFLFSFLRMFNVTGCWSLVISPRCFCGKNKTIMRGLCPDLAGLMTGIAELKCRAQALKGQTPGPQEKHSLLRLVAFMVFIDLFWGTAYLRSVPLLCVL